MATPITDLGQRLHDAGFTPEQTRAVASAFEARCERLFAGRS